MTYLPEDIKELISGVSRPPIMEPSLSRQTASRLPAIPEVAPHRGTPPNEVFRSYNYDQVLDRCPGSRNWLSLQRVIHQVGPTKELTRGVKHAFCKAIAHRIQQEDLEGATLSLNQSKFLVPALGRCLTLPSLEMHSLADFERLARLVHPQRQVGGFTVYVSAHDVLASMGQDLRVSLPKIGVYICRPPRAEGYPPLPVVRRHEETHAADILAPLRTDPDSAVLSETIAFFGEYLGLVERADFTTGSRDAAYWEDLLLREVLPKGGITIHLDQVLRPFMGREFDSGLPTLQDYATGLAKWLRFMRATNDSAEVLPALMSCKGSLDLAMLMSERYPTLQGKNATFRDPFTISGEPRGLLGIADHYYRHFGQFYDLGLREIRSPWWNVKDAYSSLAPFLPGVPLLGLEGLRIIGELSGWNFDTSHIGGFYFDVRRRGDLFEAVVQW